MRLHTVTKQNIWHNTSIISSGKFVYLLFQENVLKDHWQVLWWHSNDICQLSSFYKLYCNFWAIFFLYPYFVILLLQAVQNWLGILLAVECNCEVLMYLSCQLYCNGSFQKFLTRSRIFFLVLCTVFESTL